VQKGRPADLRYRIEIADSDGKLLAVIAFGELVTIIGGRGERGAA